MRLIDADARIEVQLYDEEAEEWSLKTCTVEEYLNYASEMPQTIDAVPVVRCWECRYGDTGMNPKKDYIICEYYDRPCINKASDYCSRGERRSDDE